MNEGLSINMNIQSSSRNQPQFFPYGRCLLRGKSIPVPPWPNRIHSHSGRKHPSGILGVYDRSGV